MPAQVFFPFRFIRLTRLIIQHTSQIRKPRLIIASFAALPSAGAVPCVSVAANVAVAQVSVALVRRFFSRAWMFGI